MRWSLVGVAYHFMMALLNGISLRFEPTLTTEIIFAGIGLVLWGSAWVYHGWFGGLLYGHVKGFLAAVLASFPFVGLGILGIFWLRARKELQACGWQVKWFSIAPPRSLES